MALLSFRLRHIFANIAKLLRPLDQRPLAALLFFRWDRFVHEAFGGAIGEVGRLLSFSRAGWFGARRPKSLFH